ncbi:hypothetical protein [Paractinoplanes lichenicola]|uniref:Uncharacterized protein n=1 Tax=Paractinoplanes lichenicola TaxID=2802976 RepID=A0ABS1VUL8_9ACTN|nr:hypothetical protein [Actinoplanes lichenicola]MBL7258132.1 hypothetical protein [Actinoplanes lichenicola]
MIGGRYEGASQRFSLELRVEPDLSVVSGDVALTGADPAYLASFRTDTGILTLGHPWPMACLAGNGTATRGHVTVRERPGDTLDVELKLDGPLNGLEFGVLVEASLRRTGAELRRLGVETEYEQRVARPGPVQFGGAAVTFEECFRRAGIEVLPAGDESTIPARNGGWEWNDANLYGVLDTLDRFKREAAQRAQRPLAAPAWQLQLLMLSRSTRDNLYGVMFDLDGKLPRQGCAVFAEEIREHQPERQVIHTIAHEVGHALNLTHRFEPSIGRDHSTSFMNYPWAYLGGDREDEYWQKADYTFDPDELAFLRHGTRPAVMPGGAAFHSHDYWSLAPGGHPPYVPDQPTPGLALTLVPPEGGPYFAFGQPVQLTVSLANSTGAPIWLPAGILDIKAGYLGVAVQRMTGTVPVPAAAEAFVPMTQRCLSFTSDNTELPDGFVKDENISVWFGANGFAVAEPGGYRLTPILNLPGRAGRPPRVVVGRPLTIRVAYPKTADDERHAVELLEPEVGAWLALGGGNACGGAAGTVQAIQEERATRFGVHDPLAASLTRTLGIHFSRSYLTADARRQFTPGPTDDTRAVRLLSRLVADPDAMSRFDRVTAAATRSLATKVRQR